MTPARQSCVTPLSTLMKTPHAPLAIDNEPLSVPLSHEAAAKANGLGRACQG
jgi:hypothetical protein